MKFRRRLVALAQAQQQRQQNAQIIVNTESRSLEERRQPGNQPQVNQQSISLQVASKSTDKGISQFNQIMGTAREVQSKPQDRLIMIMQKNEGMLNSVRDGASNQQAIINPQTNQPQVRRNDSKMLSSQEGQNMVKNIMTISSNEGSASRSINNQQQNYHNQLSNSLQIDGSRRIAPQKNKISQQHLSTSSQNANRFANSQKQLANSSQLSNQAVANRRRQHNLANNNADSNTIQIDNNFGMDNFNTRGPAYGKLLQNNTTGSQFLKQEIQEINKGLRESQKSQTILMPAGISNQKSMSQIQNRLSTDNKSSVTRKPSRGNQKNMKNTIIEKNQATTNKLIFSTPALNTDNSQSSLPSQNVIFHPHPLNGNVQNNESKSLEGNINRGNQGYMSTQNNQIIFNATTAIGNTSSTIAVNSARPQSQKMTIPIQQSNQQAVNNRNSRKNLRPLGKKNNQNSQSNFKTKTKNVSREQYVTTNDQFIDIKQKIPNQNIATQNIKSFQSLQQQNPTLNIQQMQQEMSYSSSRERGILIGSLNFNSQKPSQYIINQQSAKTIPKDLVYSQNVANIQQSQQQSNQMTNITNKNVLFKFKKSGNSNKYSSQMQVIDAQGNVQVSDFNQFNTQEQNGLAKNVVAYNSQKQSRRGTNGMQKMPHNQAFNNLQNTQPLHFDNINGKNQLLPGPNIVSQRSHGQHILIPGDIQINNNVNSQQKIKIAEQVGATVQKQLANQGSLRQRSIQEQHGYIEEQKQGYQRAVASQLLNQQVDNLNQLSEIGIVEQLSKEESIINNPLLLLEPSHQTPNYPNGEPLISNANEVSSFHEAPVGAGFSNLSEIEKLMAEGSQLSRIDSSEVHIYINERTKEENENKNTLDLKLSEINQKDYGTIQQPLTNIQSARQLSINTNKQGQGNLNIKNMNEVFSQNTGKKQFEGQSKQNTSGKQTTVLGSLTSNFQTTQQKKQIMPQKIIQGQSNSQQQIPTIQQINTLLISHNSVNNAADSARAINPTNGVHLNSNKYQTNVQQSAINSKLIKINKSKKMVDTARRSRIKQLDGYNSQTQETQGSKGNISNEIFIAPESMKLSQIQSNCPPSRQNLKQGQIPVSATNSQSKNKQLFSGSQQALHFNNTQQFVNPLASSQAQKLEALMNSQRKQQNPKVNSLGRNIGIKKNMDDLSDNNYQSSTNQNQIKLSQQQSRNELQLTMNINTSQTQINWAKHDQLGSQSTENKQLNMKNNLSVKNQKQVRPGNQANLSDQKGQFVKMANDTVDVQQLPLLGKYQTCDGNSQEQKQQTQQDNFSGQGNILEIALQQQQYQLSVKNTPQKSSQMHLTSKVNPNSIAQTQRSQKTIKENLIQQTKSVREGSTTNSANKNIQHKIKFKDPNKNVQNLNQVSSKDDQNPMQNMQKMKMNSTLKSNTVQDNDEQHQNLEKSQKINQQVGNQEIQEHIQIDKEKLPQIYDVSSVQTSNQTSIILPTQQEIEDGKQTFENDQTQDKNHQEIAQQQQQMQSEFIHVQNQQSNQTSSKKSQRDNQQEIDPNKVKPDYNLHVTQQNQMNQQQQQQVTIGSKARDQRTTMDTNSNRKQTTSDSLQRTNFNTSMQNIPRGLINTAFSLSSVTSKDEIVIPALPTTPQNILRYYIHELTDFEKAEVLDYDMIYFLGKSREKKVDQKKNKTVKGQPEDQDPKVKAGKTKSSCSEGADKKDAAEGEKFIYNYGYDDEKGDYKVVVGDHIGYRYEIVEFLGKGSFGTALGCIDHKEKREVAVKIVKNKKKYYYQASVELKILQYLRQHDHEDIMNVIHIEDYVVFRKHLCMSFERLSMNLFEFLKINDFNGFDHNLIRRFAIQLLYALKYLKQLEIIHCDLKPENILLKEENKSGIKIIDFGSSTFIDEKVYTYIQSRFYRAPEIMLGIPYTPAIDMWSLGCIMAELYIGYPLFPGESENDQMSRIMEMRDVPPKDVLAISERKQKFFKDNHGTLEPIMLKNSKGKLRKPNGKPLDYVIGDEDADFNDFVIKCLDWNPKTRLTPDEALKHVWVLKGLPPQVLIHHQKMHNIQTPELPQSVKMARDEFLFEQQKEQELMMKQQQRKQRGQGKNDQVRDISYNPTAGRPQIQLKTPRNNQQPQLTNLKAISTSNQKLLSSKQADQRSQDRLNYQTAAYPTFKVVGAVGPVDQIPHLNSQRAHQGADEITTPSAGNTGSLGRKRFVIKKASGVEGGGQPVQIINRIKN